MRLRSDGVVEWEENLDAVNRKKHTSRISAKDLTQIQQRLNAVDQSILNGQLGRYATYVDTSVDLEVHLVTAVATSDFTLMNPWESTLTSRKIGGEKAMPEAVKAVFCEISRLRAQLSGDSVDPACTGSSDK